MDDLMNPLVVKTDPRGAGSMAQLRYEADFVGSKQGKQ